MKLKDLISNPANPRKISDLKLKMLEKSMKEFGDLSGICYNRTTQRLFGGHMRLRILPPDSEIQLDGAGDTGFVIINGDRFHCRFVSWDETKEKAAMIAANQHGGEWELPILTDHINHLNDLNIDLDLLGFDPIELQGMMAPVFIPDLKSDFQEPDQKIDPTLKEPQLKLCPNCGVVIEGG